MNARAARQIREGILLARQVDARERQGYRPRSLLAQAAFARTISPANPPLWVY